MKINVTIEIDDEELKKIIGVSKGNKKLVDNSELSRYAVIVDGKELFLTDISDIIIIKFKQLEEYFNALLKKDKVIRLNQVYEKLNVPKTMTGEIVGWVYCEDSPAVDNFISFGIYDIFQNVHAINGMSTIFTLDFNVDGVIHDIVDRIGFENIFKKDLA